MADYLQYQKKALEQARKNKNKNGSQRGGESFPRSSTIEAQQLAIELEIKEKRAREEQEKRDAELARRLSAGNRQEQRAAEQKRVEAPKLLAAASAGDAPMDRAPTNSYNQVKYPVSCFGWLSQTMAGYFLYFGFLKLKYLNVYLALAMIVNVLDLVTDIVLCTTFTGFTLAVQIFATLCGVGYLAAMVLLFIDPRDATGLIFNDYFMPFLGDMSGKKRGPFNEEVDVTIKKRLVIQSYIFLQSFSEDGITIINALLNGKKFEGSGVILAYSITLCLGIFIITDLGHMVIQMGSRFLCCGKSAEGSCVELTFLSFIFFLWVCCTTLWVGFFSLFFASSSSKTYEGLLYFALSLVILGTIVSFYIYWHGGLGAFNMWDEFKQDRETYVFAAGEEYQLCFDRAAGRRPMEDGDEDGDVKEVKRQS